MKSISIIFISLIIFLELDAQIKVIENGSVHLGAPLNTSNYVTIGDRARYCNANITTSFKQP